MIATPGGQRIMNGSLLVLMEKLVRRLAHTAFAKMSLAQYDIAFVAGSMRLLP